LRSAAVRPIASLCGIASARSAEADTPSKRSTSLRAFPVTRLAPSGHENAAVLLEVVEDPGRSRTTHVRDPRT